MNDCNRILRKYICQRSTNCNIVFSFLWRLICPKNDPNSSFIKSTGFGLSQLSDSMRQSTTGISNYTHFCFPFYCYVFYTRIYPHNISISSCPNIHTSLLSQAFTFLSIESPKSTKQLSGRAWWRPATSLGCLLCLHGCAGQIYCFIRERDKIDKNMRNKQTHPCNNGKP